LKVLSNNGNTQLCEYTKETLLYPLRFLRPSQLARYKRGYQSDVDETLAAGLSRTWYIPLLGDLFAINEVFMQAFQGRLIYKVEFDRAAWVDGFPQLEELSIVSRHIYYNSAVMQSRLEAERNTIRQYNFRSFTVKNSDKLITAGANVEVLLDGFTKRASEMYLQLWKNGESLADIGQYIDSYDITDAGNKSYIGGTAIDATYNDVILSAAHDYEPVCDATTDPWTVISFTPENMNDYATGESHGSHLFTGKEILKIKISADLPSAGYQLRIYFGEHNRMESVGGKFSLTSA
jgi:hypothetical protein